MTTVSRDQSREANISAIASGPDGRLRLAIVLGNREHGRPKLRVADEVLGRHTATVAECRGGTYLRV